MNDNRHVCDDSVFRKIFETYSRDLYNFLYYKYGSENNPEDLMQEAFARLWANCSKVSPEKAKSFLFTVANNQMLNDLARKKTVLNYQKEHTDVPTDVSPHYVLEETEYMERLKQALEDLPEDQRVTFMMNRAEGLKHREIAERLGISQKAVEKRIYKAVERLQEKLGKF
ncbi:MAG: RNA polymerase sigma factor [Cyclobacteriaceae bacterium]|nr:RNA polymerase sigma factor [Cyclobacteriaceae bacterium]MBX2956242.1 RNA polymerase sigma factor [Cyclobacteriaceae bacterium]